jgi:hypothetical protein
MAIVDTDRYPEAAKARRGDPNRLRAGNAMVTLVVNKLEARTLDWITPPIARAGALLAGCHAGTMRGLGEMR